MPDMDIWPRYKLVKDFIEYLSSATGEQHDVAVYDTGYEFDTNSPKAVLFIAGFALTKASRGKKSFIVEIPDDGSVVPLDKEPTREGMMQAYLYRKKREQESEMIYIPDSDKYFELIAFAIHTDYIEVIDMTDEERKEYERKEKAREEGERMAAIVTRIFLGIPIALCVCTLFYIMVGMAK